MPVRAILFDKDGTLLDFEATWSPFARRLVTAVSDGDEALEAGLLARIGLDHKTGRFLADSVLAAGTNRQVAGALYAHLGPDGFEARVRDLDRQAAEHAATGSKALAGVAEALGLLRTGGYRLGVGTNDSTAGAEAAMAALGVAQMFDGIFGYDAVARPKPEPDMLVAFCDMTGVSPRDLAMVGDSRHDLAAARAAGAGLAIGVLSGAGTRATLEPLADVILGSVAELPAFLARL